MIKRWLCLLVIALALCGTTAVRAQPAASSEATGAAASSGRLNPAEAQRVIDQLEDPQQRAQLIETLRAITNATMAKASPPPTAKPAAQAVAPAVALAPDSLGAQLLSQLASWPETLADEAAVTVQTIADFPVLWGRGEQVVADPAERRAVLDALWQLALVVGAALLFEALAQRALARPISVLTAYVPKRERGNGALATAPHHANGAWPMLRRLPFALARLALDLIPLGVFWGTGSLFTGITPSPLTRAAILIVVNAYAAGRIIGAVARMLVSPAVGRLRLMRLGDDEARYLIRWVHQITTVAISGGALASLALLVGFSEGAYSTLVRLVALIVAVMLSVEVLRSRQTIALRLRAGPDAEGGVARWRDWLAGTWHYLALSLIMAGWFVWAAGVRNGLGGLRLLIGTVAILVAARLLAIIALGMLDRAARLTPELTHRLPGAAARATHYFAPARFIMRALIAVATAVALLQFWGADAVMWFERGQLGGKLVSALATIAVAAVVAIIVWEGANAALERRLARLSKAGSAAHSARLRTLLPMLRAALLCVTLAVVGLTALSEIGVAIAPLLAGAGVVGIAVGFGAQKLVQDVITGMFVLFENAIQIGDWVTVAGLSGNVERLSVRNIWLRGNDGAVHIIPFSAVTSITNTNRGLGNAVASVTVAYTEDSDRVAGVLREIAEEIRHDGDLGAQILGDPEFWVDAVKASGVTLAGTISCTDAGRWPVQHEFNRRMKQRFQELGIELANS